MDAWIVLWYGNGKAWSIIAANIITADKAITAEHNVTWGGGGQIEVMIQKLPKLHEHVREVLAGLYDVRMEETSAHLSSTWLSPRPPDR